MLQLLMDKIVNNNKRKRVKLVVVAGSSALLLLAATIFYSYTIGKNRIKVDVDKITIDEVTQGPFQEYIPVDGTVQPIKTVYIDAIEGGTVEQIFIEDGKMVKAGDAIMRLSNQQLHMDVIRNEGQLLDQQNNLRSSRMNMDQQSNKLRDELLKLDTDLKQAERTYKANQQLIKSKNISQNEFNKSEEDYFYLIGKRKLIVQNLKSDSTFRSSQEKQVDFSLDLINKNLAFLQSSLGNLSIKAPINGQLSALKAELGETKAKGENIAQIDDISDYKIRAKIGEYYTTKMFVGLKGQFMIDGKEYTLVVNKIFPEVKNGEFEADLLFEGDKPASIKRGQSLQIKLELGQSNKAKLLPRGSFYQETGGAWVYVVYNGIATKRNIKIGRQNPLQYEVLEGLEPGDKVITSKYSGFNNADEIIINDKK